MHTLTCSANVVVLFSACVLTARLSDLTCAGCLGEGRQDPNFSSLIFFSLRWGTKNPKYPALYQERP